MKISLKSTLFIVILIIGLAFGTENQIFNEIAQEGQFGQALSALIQMHTQVPAGVNEIDNLLKTLKATLEQEQIDEKEKIENKQTLCESQYADYEQQISDTKSLEADQQQEQSDLQEELQQKNQQIDDDSQQISQENEDKNQYEEQKVQAEQIYLENKANFQESIDACDEAIRLLNEIIKSKSTSSFIQNGVMFVQLSQKFEKIKDVLEKGTQKQHNAFIEPIINILMELGSSSKIDLEAIQEIISLIETLQERLREGLVQHQTQYEQTTSGLDTLISDIQNQIYTHQQQLDANQERISYIEDRLQQLTDLNTITSDLVIQVQQLKDSLETSCQFEQQAYSEAEVLRQTQILTLEKLIDYFDSQVVTTTQNIN